MEESNLAPDDLGHLGEVTFGWLTGKPPFVVNKVQRDRTGWDFLVEINPPEREGVALDARHGLAAILVQVKATYRGPKASVRLSLSAADRLAKRPGPSFIVAIAFDRLDDQVFEVFVIEMIGERLAAVLKALRGRQRDGNFQINHASISFPLRPAERLSEASGAALHDRLSQTLTDGEDAYIDAKRDQRKSLGYGPDRLVAKLTMHDVSTADVADILIGKREFRATISDVEERRFGIALPSDILVPGEGIMRLNPLPKGPCRVRVRSKALKRPILFAGEYFEAKIPGATRFIERARYECGLFEADRADTTITLRAHCGPNDEQEFPISHWVDFHRVWSALAEVPVTVEIIGQPGSWEFNGSGQRDEDMRARLHLFETAKPISGSAIYAQQKAIFAAAGMWFKDAPNIRIGFEATRDSEDDFPLRRLVASAFDLGGCRIAYAGDVTLKQFGAAKGDLTWYTTTNAGVGLEIIDRTPVAFRNFIDEARDRSGITPVLFDRMSGGLDVGFLEEALGEMSEF
jgi:hypothetical protein